MAKIIAYPKKKIVCEAAVTGISPQRHYWIKFLFILVVDIVYSIFILLWPLIQWLLAFDCLFQLMRTLYYWNTPGIHAGWVFLAHFSALVGLMLFIMSFKPLTLPK